ncbi:nucleoside diphosphate kinase [Gorgonomyces haynaldii]|nr:nucleoside diphosphate kinase [Gorgonomyces haynaldii]
MSAGQRKKQEQAPSPIALTNEEWNQHMSKSGLRIVDCYAKWAGPCDAMQSIFKRLKTQYGDQLTVSQAQSDDIEALRVFKNKSCPHFLFYYDGVLVQVVKGANSPLVETVIKEQLALEASGHPHKPYVLESADAPAVQEAHMFSENHNEAPEGASETFAIIKPDGMAHSRLEQIMEMIRLNRFEIKEKRKIWLNNDLVKEMYPEQVEQPYFNAVCTYLTSAPVLCLVLGKENAIRDWRKLMGPTSSIQAKESAPESIRALHGTDSRVNAVYGADNATQVELLKGLLLNSNITALPIPEETSFGKQKTLLLLKPDIVSGGKVDELLDRVICKGFHVVKREELTLTAEQLPELYPKLKDDPIFPDVVKYLTGGPCIALVITGECVVSELIEMLGPHDPALAKESCPMSVRALFGTDRIHNAVHCPDTVEEATHQINVLFPHADAFETRPSTAMVSPSKVEALEHAMLERTLALIKPDAYPHKKDEILAIIQQHGFNIVKQKEIHLSLGQAQEFYKEHADKVFYNDLTAWMSRTNIYALVLEKASAISAWRELAGPTNAIKAKEIAPDSIRAKFGTDGSQNAVHGSDSPASAEREIQIVFGDDVSASPDPLVIEPTLALIKPDAYPGHKEEILQRIKAEGFTISHEQEVVFTPEKAQEFYKEHAGKPFYETLCGWMSSAPIYALVLEKSEAVKQWRQLAGPTNSEKARQEFPQSIRALYGTDGSQNAVHGSDSPASAEREIKVVFGDQAWESIQSRLQPKKELKKSQSTLLKKSQSATKLSGSVRPQSGLKKSEPKLGSTKSLTNVNKSQSALRGSKTNIASAKGSKSNLAQSSKPELNGPGSPKGSKANLAKTASKSNLGSKAELKVSGSKSNLVKSESQKSLPKSRAASNSKLAGEAVP